MKQVIWTNDDGYRRISMMRDMDKFPETGVPVFVPDLREMDWEAIVRDLHNLLVDRGLTSTRKFSENGGLQNAVLLIVKNRVIEFFRQEERGLKKEK